MRKTLTNIVVTTLCLVSSALASGQELLQRVKEEFDMKNKYPTLHLVEDKEHFGPELGVYDIHSNTLVLKTGNIARQARKTGESQLNVARRVTWHEIGHHKSDLIAERAGIVVQDSAEDLKTFDHFKALQEMMSTDLGKVYCTVVPEFLAINQDAIQRELLRKTIWEGIAMVHEHHGKEPKEVEWPKYLSDLRDPKSLHSFIYDNGHSLAHPILKQFGDKGIENLLGNLPTNHKVTTILDYQRERFADLYRQVFNITDPTLKVAVDTEEYPNDTVLASYSPRTGTITIRSKKMEGRSMIDRPMPSMGGMSMRPSLSVSGIIKHEIGHHDANLVAQELGIPFWPNYEDMEEFHQEYRSLLADRGHYSSEELKAFVKENEAALVEYLGLMMTSEGMAEHFQFGDKYPYASIAPRNLGTMGSEDTLRSFIYGRGYDLVKPILSKHGREGTKFVIQNPPTKEEMLEIRLYHKRAEQHFSKK